tara:strand:- start:206 stop:1366 length:1161 start_codon:yes stop_codon:yes gene_type:complete
MNKKIILRGPFLTSSGYGVHARQIARYVLDNFPNCTIKVEPLPWGITSWKINPDDEGGLIGRIMDKSGTQISGKADISIQVQLPNEWDTTIAHRNIGVTAGVETDRCNPEWINCVNKMDMVIVPSNHAKLCFENTSNNIDTPIKVIPESFHDSITNSNEEIDLNLNTKFNFLLVGQLTATTPDADRKNTFYAIKWFCEAFKDRKDVGLIVKTNRGKNTTLDFRLIDNLFAKLVNEVRQGEYPKIHLLHGNLSNEKIAALYKNKRIKALLAPTKGEGYGLPILEAAASGLPVIATDWSGHLDFMNLGKFIKLDYDLTNIPDERVDNAIFVKDSKWAMPKEEDFKQKLLKFSKGDSIPRKWASNLSKKIREKYSFEEISKLYDDVLQI